MNKHRFWYITFSILSFLSVADIASKTAELTGDTSVGVVSLAISWVLALPFLVFSTNAGSISIGVYATVLDIVFSFAIIWIVIAIYEWKQMRKPKPTTPIGATIK